MFYSQLYRASDVAQIGGTLERDGYAVIRGLFTPEQMRALNSDMDEAFSRTLPGKPAATIEGSSISSDEAIQAAIFGSNTKRIDKLFARSETWRELVDDTVLHGICTHALGPLGDYWLNTAQMIEIGPGTHAGPLHPDAGLWWLLLGLDDATAPEIVLNFLVAATKTTVSNGATGVVEHSHNLPMSEVLKDMNAVIWKTSDEQVKQIELDPGDCLLVGGRIFHRGGANTTSDEYRRLLSIMVTSCALTPEEAHPLYINASVAQKLSERARRFLGFSSMRPAIGSGFWRTG